MSKPTNVEKLCDRDTSLMETENNKGSDLPTQEPNMTENQPIIDVSVQQGNATLQKPDKLEPQSIIGIAVPNSTSTAEMAAEFAKVRVSSDARSKHLTALCSSGSPKLEERSLKVEQEVNGNVQKSFTLTGESTEELKVFTSFLPSFDSSFLTNIQCENIELNKADLISALQSCPLLESLVLQGVKITGDSNDRVHLPLLRVFHIDLLDSDFWLGLQKKNGVTVLMEKLSLFYKDVNNKNWKMENFSTLEMERFSIHFESNLIDINRVEGSVHCQLWRCDVTGILQNLHFSPTHLQLHTDAIRLNCLEKFISLKQLTLNFVVFIGEGRNAVDLSELLSNLPQLETLEVNTYSKSSPILINLNYLPAALRKLKLFEVRLLYNCNELDKPYDSILGNNSPSPGKAQLRTISLFEVVLPSDEHEVQQLFGKCETLFINGSISESRATSALLDKLVAIDSMQRIYINQLYWKRKDNREFSKWLQDDGPLVNSTFCLEKLHPGIVGNQGENEVLWKGREIDGDEFFAVLHPLFEERKSGVWIP